MPKLNLNFKKSIQGEITMKKYILYSLWLTILSSILLYTHAKVDAYYVYPEKWSSNTVEYDQTALGGWSNAIWDGAKQWEAVSPSPFKFARSNNSGNTNDVYFGSIDGQYGTYAQTQTWFPGGVWISRFTMKLDSGETWTSGSPSSSQLDIVSVAVHEFGHAAGIGHTQWWRCWGNENDRPTMCGSFPYGKVYFRYLEDDDRNALNAKYP